MKKIIFLFITLNLFFISTKAQAPKRMTSAEIHQAIKKLNFLGSALYVAAHPDDENTRLISWLANEAKANTAYLSLTRGDGGQNLIGPEIESLLGLIRTQELLAARRVDGGKQMFSRANDFGFSKHPDETMKIWNKEEVLSDVVWAIRKWQPDILINRFDHRTPGTTHGHHTASGILSLEASELAGNPASYPEQVPLAGTWKPARVFLNISSFFFRNREEFEKSDKSNLAQVDVGVYYPALGKSNTEIAAESRSMHKCQGFGSAGVRGSEPEYLELLKGTMPTEKSNLFEGINTTWTRVQGGAPIGKILAAVEAGFKAENPAASVPQLMQAYRLIEQLPDSYWKSVKRTEIQEVIKACLGLFHEALASEPSATPGENVSLRVEVIQRLGAPVRLEKVRFAPMGSDTTFALPLEVNKRVNWSRRTTLPADMPMSNPYWLNEPNALGLYSVAEQRLRGLPETPRQLKAEFHYTIAGIPIVYSCDVAYKDTDPVDGEVYQPFEVTPPVYTRLDSKVYLFADSKAQEVTATVKAGKAGIEGTLQLEAPAGWIVQPAQVSFTVKRKGEELPFRFTVTPPAGQSDGTLTAVARLEGKTWHRYLLEIKYDHIPVQTVLLDAHSRIVRIDLQKAGSKVGYVAGAGDDIPASLRAIGYEVELLQGPDLNPQNLAQYDAVITGVRAYNTNDDLQFKNPQLLEYVKNGGTLIVQYNTNSELRVPAAEIGPFPLRISRDRVTVEEADMRFLLPEHPVLNYPNKITAADFEGWVQERGLYFPDQWDKAYVAPLSCNDPGEPAKNGALLVAKHGQGHFVYTGLSFFRELPSGVPGAFRLFANLISIGKTPKP